MKTLINKSLAVLAVLMLTISISSCSKSSGIVDPTKDNGQNDQNASNDVNKSNDINYNTNYNNNTGN
jgi:hypothetical protein